MSASLFGERFIGMRTPAWHQLGIVRETQITATEAFQEVGLNYRYHTLPIGATLPDGTFLQTTEDVAVYREPTHDDPQWKSLGIVSKGYSYLQNDELAAGIDAISEKTGWMFETAGALGDGGTIFVCLKADTHSIFGDEVKSYFLVSDGKAANRALQIAVTPVRVVCQNTLIAADNSSSLTIKIPHNSGVESEYKTWLNLISGLQQSQENTFADLRLMASVKIGVDKATEIFKAAFPDPVQNQRVRMSQSIPLMPGVSDELKSDASGALARAVQAYEYNLNQAQRWTAGATQLYVRFNDGNEQGGQMSRSALEAVRETPYAALQAVTEACDWGGTNRESVASAALFGARAAQKSRAWTAALSVAKSLS